VLGVVLAAGLWWAYFDVVALFVASRLTAAEPGRAQNELARDAYSLIHFPVVAGIVLVALGLKKTLEHVGDPLAAVPAAALCGGAALFLLGNVAFKARAVRALSAQRIAAAAVLAALIPVSTRVTAVVALGLVAGVVAALVAFETTRFGEGRAEIRHPST
jgi:low temperature requirement protein LtrA